MSHLRANHAKALVLGSVLSLAGVLVGCEQNDARAEASQTSQETTVASAAPVAAEPTGKSEFSDEAFVAKLTPPGAIKAGQPLTFNVSLEARGGYKVNDEYPLKFVLNETPGVLPGKGTVRKEDGKVEKKQAELPVVVTLEKPGKYRVGGRLSFSVCTDERCLIEKRDLLVTVDAT